MTFISGKADEAHGLYNIYGQAEFLSLNLRLQLAYPVTESTRSPQPPHLAAGPCGIACSLLEVSSHGREQRMGPRSFVPSLLTNIVTSTPPGKAWSATLWRHFLHMEELIKRGKEVPPPAIISCMLYLI